MPPSALAFRHRLPAAAGPGRGARRPHARPPAWSASTWSAQAPAGARRPRPAPDPAARTAAYTAEAVRPSRVPDRAGRARRPRGAADRPVGRRPDLGPRRRHVRRPGSSPRARRREPVTSARSRSPASARSGVTWAHGVAIPPGRDPGRGAHPHRRHLVGLARPPLRRRARPRPRQRPRPGTPGPAPTRCSSATSTRSRSAPISRRPAAGGHEARGDRPGPRRPHDRASAPRSTPAPWTATTAPTRSTAPPTAQPAAGDARRRRRRPRGRDVHAAAGDLLARPVGRRRAACASKSSLHYGDVHAGFVHHTVNANDYTRAEVPGAPPQHLRLPHAVPRLERHRLQLPRRPVRPDLGGPLRRHRPPRRRRAHPRLQRLLLRDVGDRQLRDRPAEPGDARRPTARCSPGSSRCTASTPSSTQQYVTHEVLPGDQRPPRRRRDRLPGPVPLRQAPEDPEAGRGRQRGWSRPPARVRPGLDARTRTSSYGGPATARRS